MLTQDVTSRFVGERGPTASVAAAFRLAAVFAVSVPVLVALFATNVGVAQSVGLAFAVAASTFCPLLMLGIWWRGLTDAGALAGLAAGGLGAGGAAVLNVVGVRCLRLARRPPHPARGLERADRVRDDGAGVAGHPVA